MKENKYFKIDEFKCKCGNCELPTGMPSDELIDVLVEIREHFDKPLKINSGYRCPTHNKKVGGASKSRHIQGDAVDFVIKDVPTADVYRHVISTYNDRPFGIALSVNQNDIYRGFVHLDTRGYKARWGYNEAGKKLAAAIHTELNIA